MRFCCPANGQLLTTPLCFSYCYIIIKDDVLRYVFWNHLLCFIALLLYLLPSFALTYLRLTRILKQSLGGNTLTSVLCAVTPAPMHREETVSTLKFGQLCKSIKNKVQTNDGALDDKALIRQYRNTINEQRAQLEALQKIIAASPDMLAAAAASTASDPAGAGGGAGGGGAASAAASSVNAEELARLKEQAVEQQSLLGVLQARLDEYQDLEESKAAFEEYEQHSRQELDDDIAKLEVLQSCFMLFPHISSICSPNSSHAHFTCLCAGGCLKLLWVCFCCVHACSPIFTLLMAGHNRKIKRRSRMSATSC